MTNPYNPAFGRTPERFLGRDEIVFEILSALDYPNSPWQTTVLIGIRGSGKTALLSEIDKSAKAMGCITISVSPVDNMLNVVLSQLYSKMPKSILKAMPKPSKLSVAGIVELDMDEDKPYFLNNFQYQITLMLEELRKKKLKVLFLVDESQKHSDELRTLVDTYQRLIREGFEVNMVLAGLPNVISDILNDDVLTFLRRANQVVVDNIELWLVLHDYEVIFREESGISNEILEKAAHITEGYPYLFQLIGYYLWEYLKSGNSYENILDEVMIIVKGKMFQNVHRLLFRELSAGDREFVFAMAVDKNGSKFADIISRTGKSKNHLSTYRIRLIDHGYIKAVGHGEVAFCLPFTREFLIQESSFAEL